MTKYIVPFFWVVSLMLVVQQASSAMLRSSKQFLQHPYLMNNDKFQFDGTNSFLQIKNNYDYERSFLSSSAKRKQKIPYIRVDENDQPVVPVLQSTRDIERGLRAIHGVDEGDELEAWSYMQNLALNGNQEAAQVLIHLEVIGKNLRAPVPKETLDSVEEPGNIQNLVKILLKDFIPQSAQEDRQVGESPMKAKLRKRKRYD